MPRQFAMRANHPNAGIAARSGIKTVGNAKVNSFEEAEAFLSGAMERQIASNVLIIRSSPDVIHVKLYKTDIITYYRDGTFTAQNGGYNTPTTSARAQQFGPKGFFFYHEKKVLHPISGVVKAK